MATVEVKFDDKQLRQNVRDFDGKLRRGVQMVVDRRAAVATGWLKGNARWIDRTGAARSGLVAIPHHANSYSEIVMAYSVNYGIWLEVAHDAKFAIITPALRIMGDALMKDLTLLIERIQGGSAGALASPPTPSPIMPPVPEKDPTKTQHAARQAWNKKPRNNEPRKRP